RAKTASSTIPTIPATRRSPWVGRWLTRVTCVSQSTHRSCSHVVPPQRHRLRPFCAILLVSMTVMFLFLGLEWRRPPLRVAEVGLWDIRRSAGWGTYLV